MNATGVVSLNASGQGSLENPQLLATIQVPSLVVQKQKIEGINLQLNVANHVGNATLASTALHTSIQAKASVDLTGDYACRRDSRYAGNPAAADPGGVCA